MFKGIDRRSWVEGLEKAARSCFENHNPNQPFLTWDADKAIEGRWYFNGYLINPRLRESSWQNDYREGRDANEASSNTLIKLFENPENFASLSRFCQRFSFVPFATTLVPHQTGRAHFLNPVDHASLLEEVFFGAYCGSNRVCSPDWCSISMNYFWFDHLIQRHPHFVRDFSLDADLQRLERVRLVLEIVQGSVKSVPTAIEAKRGETALVFEYFSELNLPLLWDEFHQLAKDRGLFEVPERVRQERPDLFSTE